MLMSLMSDTIYPLYLPNFRFEAVIVTTKYLKLRKARCESPPPQGNPCYCGDYLLINDQAACKVAAKQIDTTYFADQLPLQLNFITKDIAIRNNEGFALSYTGEQKSEWVVCDWLKLD